MDKLYESRKERLNNPLTKDEIGYVFESRYIEQIIDDINEKRYGAYLIGGIVGTGKSSVVEVASNSLNEDAILFHVRFYDEKESTDKFLQILLDKICEVLKQSDYGEVLKEEIENNEKKHRYDFEEKVTSIDEQKKSTGNGKKVSAQAGIGYLANRLFKVNAELNKEEKEEEQQLEQTSYKKEITMTKKQENLLQKIISIFNALSDINIIIVYDEMDKMKEDVLKEWFSRYKELFVENQIFHYFIVNQSSYINYSDNNLFRNPFITYFRGIYYIPLLDFSETLRYIKMMFAETNYLTGIDIYYSSLGVYRLINSHYSIKNRLNIPERIKAVIHKEVVAKLKYSYLSDLEKDLLAVGVKNAIEHIFTKKNIIINQVEETLESEQESLMMPIQYFVIVHEIINVIEQIVPTAICKKDNEIGLDMGELYKRYENIKEWALNRRNEKFTNEEKGIIQVSDMYSFLDKNSTFGFMRMPFISDKVIPLQVADNQSDAYINILINIIYSNLYANNQQVIIIKRARGNASWIKDDYVYTGIVVVDK